LNTVTKTFVAPLSQNAILFGNLPKGIVQQKKMDPNKYQSILIAFVFGPEYSFEKVKGPCSFNSIKPVSAG
jgi:hypothetical protein